MTQDKTPSPNSRAQTLRIERERKGRQAETLAALYLMSKGYKILERRYKTRFGEIDIIAKHGDTLAIVEVKARKTRAIAEDSIPPKARRRIEAAALHYVAKTPEVRALGVRFDAVFWLGGVNLIHRPDLWRPY